MRADSRSESVRDNSAHRSVSGRGLALDGVASEAEVFRDEVGILALEKEYSSWQSFSTQPT